MQSQKQSLQTRYFKLNAIRKSRRISGTILTISQNNTLYTISITQYSSIHNSFHICCPNSITPFKVPGPMQEEGFYLKESRFMTNFWQNSVPPDLKTEISLTWQELKEQVEQVEELDTSWTSHYINSTCSDCHPQKLILIASRFLRMANSTKDKLSRLKQHLLPIDSWRSILEKEKDDKERMEKDIDKDKITLTADGYIQKVDRITSEIEYELGQLLKNIPDQNNNVPHGKNATEARSTYSD
ncbi:unnamed protein product [Haemonchus placei]|uniref:Uncharacterized protein n=1 Tax=Haemonchus placei TaxID=6290 RepID=A0A3P7S683_HAEPC|nr:unnamed protein product [Haemonchus placei]